MFCSHSISVVRDSILQFRICNIELATLEFHNATLKFDNATLVLHETFNYAFSIFTPTIQHAQLSFYARFDVLDCHFSFY